MKYSRFFWLHIKKSAGISTRSLLQPYYKEVDRVNKPKNFIQASPDEYNDILNNYRVVLGEYQFRRCLFAKKFLFPNSWNEIYSFAFSREPIDRCVSMFYYLYWQDGRMKDRLISAAKQYLSTGRIRYSTSFAFDAFLEFVQESRTSDSIYLPLGIHFSTHTAPVWEDITDLNGDILLKKVFRLEDLEYGINSAFEECGIAERVGGGSNSLNINEKRRAYNPSRNQIKKIENIYSRDFELYEGAGKNL